MDRDDDTLATVTDAGSRERAETHPSGVGCSIGQYAGSPDECLDQLQMWQQEIQPDYLMLRMRQPGGPSHEENLRDIRLFGEKVIPRL